MSTLCLVPFVLLLLVRIRRSLAGLWLDSFATVVPVIVVVVVRAQSKFSLSAVLFMEKRNFLLSIFYIQG